MGTAAPALLLPWYETPEERRRLRRTAALVLAPVAAAVVGIALAPPPTAPPFPAPAPPPRIARLAEPPSKAVPLQPAPTPSAAPSPPPPARAKAAPPPAPAPAAADTARRRARRAGLLALADELTALRRLAAPEAFAAGRSRRAAGTGTDHRAVLAAQAAEGSGGVEGVADAPGGRLAGRLPRRIEAPAAAGRGGGSARPDERTSEEIQLVFDRHKAAFDALYRRALRRRAGLRGRVALELVIAPDGRVTSVRVAASEIDDEAFLRRLLARVRLLRFEDRDVAPWRGTFSIDFLPGR